MKVKIISLFLSIAFLSILAFESFSNTIIVENSSLKTIEQVLEERLADKFIDDDSLLNLTITSLTIKTNIIHKFKKTFYTFTSVNTLYRPPISI